MKDHHKDLNKAAKNRKDALDKANDQRMQAERRESLKAEARAMNRDPITDAGPVGAAVGGVVGAVVGAAAGHATGEAANPTAEESYWRTAYIHEPYFENKYRFDDYEPAYRAGYKFRNKYRDRTWDQVESDLKSDWERSKGASRLRWEQARNAARAAWNRVDRNAH